MQDILTLIEETSVVLLQAGPGDTDSLKSVDSEIRRLADLLAEHDRPRCADAVARSLELIEHSGVAAADADLNVLETVTQLMCDLQRCIQNEIPDSESKFPRQLLAPVAELTGDSGPAPAQRSDQPVSVCTADSTVDPFAAFADPEMLAGFIAEAQEHLDAADAELLKLEANPQQSECLSAVFRAFHTIKGVAGFLGLSQIAGLAHEAENLLDRAREGKLTLVGEVMEVVFASVDMVKQMVGALAGDTAHAGEASSDQLRKALITRIQSINVETPREQHVSAPQLNEPRVVDTAAPESACPDTTSAAPVAERAATALAVPAVAETVKVDRARLDKLVDLIGELVIAESMVQDLLTAAGTSTQGNRNIAQLNKITRNLQELGLSLRMVPVRATFQKMARLVRDLSKKIGKPIDFHCSGEDTELDKTVVDQIGDPLMHMVRNAVDHGIESSTDDRVRLGKPANGQVTLRAFHQGGNIFIEIQDDGRGLDRDRILKKAKERGVIAEDAVLSDREIFNLIFAPGFSTAEKITDVSGRGVGMDVVRRNVEALRGSVELRSELGHGTCFSMRLPLTLAIIEGMTVRVDDCRYVIPTLSIVELLRPKQGDIGTVQGVGEFLTVRERHLRLIRLGTLLGHTRAVADPMQAIVVIVESAGVMTGLLVDEVLGQQQAVIKSLGSRLENQPGIAGGAVMPDGRVGLILDIPGLVALDERLPTVESISV